eukprot:scaffold7489_cov96-Cylindrotheca_fusiformis.AAC.4
MSSNSSIENDISESSSSVDVGEPVITACSRKAAVQFAPFVKCKATLSRYDYTAEEAKRTWIFSDEKAEILDSHRNTAQRMASGKKPRKNTTYRGLETMNRQDILEMNVVIDTCVNAVLDEQDEQWKNDVFKWKRFAKISRKHSKESKKLAFERAKFDEREAQKAYQQMDDEMKENSSGNFITACTVEGYQAPLFKPKYRDLNKKHLMSNAYRIQTVPV